MERQSCWNAFLIRIKRLPPDSEHPAASQPTVFGLNRYVLLLIYALNAFASSSVYFGWGALSTLLFRAKIFLWVCSTEEQATFAESDQPVCQAQDADVQSLFTVCYAAHFIISAAAGFLVDVAGPKVTALLGQALNICGWTFLGACSDSFRAVVPAFILIGAGADMCFLPMLCIVNLFPGSTGFALTFMGAACSLSFAVPSILKAAYQAGISFQWVCWGYALWGPALCMAIVLFFVPLSGFIELDMYVLVHPPPTPIVSAGRRSGQPRSGTLLQESSASPADSYSQPPRSVVEGTPISCVTDDDFFQPFKKEACTFLYIGLCIYFAICSIAVSFFQQASALFLVKQAFDALEIAIPLSTVPRIILGRVADFVPIVRVMMVANAAGVLSFLFAVLDGITVDFISIMFFSIYISVLTPQMYIFIKNLFTSVHFGKLIGIATMVGGILSLISNALYEGLTMKHFNNNADPVMWGLFGTLCAAYLLLIPMAVAAKRKKREVSAYKEMSSADSLSRSAILSRRSRSSPSATRVVIPPMTPKNKAAS